MKQGDRVGPYQIDSKLGSGGNGEVWRCHGPAGDDVAVKVLTRGKVGSEGFRRFQAEIAALRLLGQHQGVLPIRDAHLDTTGAGISWLAMPVAEPLSKITEARTPEQTVAIVADIASTLADLHGRGISHRDIKPENLFRFDGRWVLGDFGLVDFPGKEAITDDERKLGPAWYIAPEMLNQPGTADGRPADIFSLAKTLWVLLTGQRYPLPGQHNPSRAQCTLRSHVAHKRLNSLDVLLEAMTDVDPAARPQAGEVRRQLQAWAVVPPAPADPTDLGAALAQAREAVLAPQSAESRQRGQKSVAHEVFESVVLADATAIRDHLIKELGLSFTMDYGAPEVFRRRRHMGTRPSIWTEERDFTAVVGTMNSVAFSIICVADLTDTGELFLSYSLRVVPRMGTEDVGTFDTLYRNGTQTMFKLGMPEMDGELADLISKTRAILPEALAHFTKLVSDHCRE
jgi:serine/threonine protein kinase